MTLKNKINYIIGNEQELDSNKRTEKIIDDTILDILESLSKRILKNNKCREFSDLMAFGFFIRKANLNKIKKRYASELNRFGRGVVFHIASSNVALNFAYSMVASLLAGNSNIIRLASKYFPQTSLLLTLIKECIKEHNYLQKKLCIIHYEKNKDINTYFSKIADARIIWGGDATINYFRSFEIKPRCVDVMFANRNSLLIIESEYILNLTLKELTLCVKKFVQGALFFEQNACTSPKLIIWYGNHKNNQLAKNKFWKESLAHDFMHLNIKGKETTDKLIKIIDLALQYDNVTYKKYGLIDTVQVNNINDIKTMENNRFGLFYELESKNLLNLNDIFNETTQTISYIGEKGESLFNSLTNNKISQFDRIVPIEKSAEFDFVWDGYDLITMLSRKINVL